MSSGDSESDADCCCEVSIFINQHISREYAEHLAAWLRQQAAVVEAYASSGKHDHHQMHYSLPLEVEIA